MKCTSGHVLTAEGKHRQSMEWCAAGPDHDDPGLFEAGYRQGWRERDVLGTPRYPDLAVDRVAALARDARAAAKGDDRPLREWLAEQFATANSGHVTTAARIDGLVDVVLRQENRILERIGSVHHTDNPNEVSLTLAGYTAAKRAEFERGRQQGDADRAARAQAEYDRGVADGRASVQEGNTVHVDCNIDHPSERAQAELRGFDRGKRIGQAEREAELLEQGWTPPESMMVTAARIEDEAAAEASTGPTAYELWRDSLTLAVAWCPDGAADEDTLGQAEIFRDRLKNYPTDIPDGTGLNDAEDEWEAKTFPAGRIDGE